MRNLYFDDFEDLACDIADTYDALDYDEEEDVIVIAKYEEARQIIKELLCLGYDAHSIEIHDDLWENYDAEYVVSLYENEVWCEPMLRENGYIEEDAPVIYVLDNCSSKVIPYCKGKTVYEVSVGIDEDDECGCDECECACKKDDKPATATTSNSVYKVNGKEVSKEEYEKVLDKFSDKYMDSVQDILLNHLEFIDEMRNFAKLFNW